MNASAFLGRQVRVRNPSTPYRRGKIVDSSANYSNRIERRVQRTPTTKSLLTIRRKVFDVENTLKALFNLNEKSLVMKKRIKLVQGQEERDSKRSTRIASNLGGLIQRPKTGAMDFISNFLTFTFLGWLFTVLQPLFGKLEGLVPLFVGAFGFFSGALTNLLNGFASFVKFGYDTHDKIKGAETEIKKQASNIKKTFDDTTSALSELLNSTTKVATSFLNIFGGKYDIAPSNTTNTTKENIITFSSLATSATPAITRYAEGGSVDSGRIDPRTPIKRGIDQRRKPEQKQKPTPQQLTTQPGKDVGGIDKIQELYNQKSSNSGFNVFSTFDRTHKSGYAALTKTSEEFKRINSTDFLGIGNLMSISVDASLGQKPEKTAYTQFAEGINYLVSFGLTQSEEFKKLNMEKMIENIVQSKVDSAINRVREEINKKSMVEEAGGPGADGEPGGIAGGEYGAYAPSGIEKQIYDYLINVKKMNDFQALGLMANISRESSFIPNNREPGGTGVGLFQWSHGRVAPFMKAVPDWETNWKAQIDYALSEPENLSLVKPGAYQSKQFKSAQEAADWWMNEWERPRDPSSGSKKHSAYLRSIPRGPSGSAKFREASIPVPSGARKGAFASGLYIGPAGDNDGQQTGLNMNLPGGIGTPIYAPFDLIYKTRGSDGKPSVGLNGTPGALGPSGQGFGYYGAYYYRVGNKEYEVMMGHFDSMPLRGSKHGEIIPRGTLLGYQGASGRSVSNTNGVYPHITLHVNGIGFNATNRELSRVANAIAGAKPEKDSRQPKLPEAPKLPPPPQSAARPTPPKFTEAYMINGKMYYVDTKGQGRITTESGGEIDFSGGKNRALLKEIAKLRELRKGSNTPRRKYGGLVYSNGSNPLLPPDKYASYNDPSMTSTILIQPVIKSNIVPINTESNSPIMFSAPNVNSSSTNFELMRS